MVLLGWVGGEGRGEVGCCGGCSNVGRRVGVGGGGGTADWELMKEGGKARIAGVMGGDLEADVMLWNFSRLERINMGFCKGVNK